MAVTKPIGDFQKEIDSKFTALKVKVATEVLAAERRAAPVESGWLRSRWRISRRSGLVTVPRPKNFEPTGRVSGEAATPEELVAAQEAALAKGVFYVINDAEYAAKSNELSRRAGWALSALGGVDVS